MTSFWASSECSVHVTIKKRIVLLRICMNHHTSVIHFPGRNYDRTLSL